MKKLYFLTLLFIGFTGFASPPVINNPTPLVVCDSLNNNYEVFDLTVKIPEVLGALNPSLYNVTFHYSFTDADAGVGPIANPNAFTNTVNPQTIYIRVEDIGDGSYSTTSLDLILNPTPIIGTPQDLSIEQIPFTGTEVFDLTSNDLLLANGDPNVTISYYLTATDAQAATNALTAPAAFIGTNGQIIWARVELATTQCASFASFHLYITNPDIVFIPDANFKQQLIFAAPTVDTNSDGEIQVTEALAYTHLTVDGTGISSLEGINSFTNLNHLGLGGFSISTMDISGLTSLTELFCDNNQFTSLDVSNSVNLVNLQCANNHLNSINISGLTHLKYISCYLNELTAINVAGLSTLESLDCRNNQLSSLDLSGLTNLQILNCNTNLIPTLDTLQSPNLLQLACAFNPIPTLDVSPYPNLTYLACGSLELIAIDISSLANLTTFYLYQSQQTVLDISNNNSIYYTVIEACPNLTVLNLKNGYPTLDFYLFGMPNLDFICANESNINLLQTIISTASNAVNSNAVVNSYCSFTPGGNYNTITGTIRFDTNNNGCDDSDIVQSNIRVNINDATSSGASFTSTSGNYAFYTQAGSFDITPNIENPTWFNFSPTSATIPFADNNDNTVTQDFCITSNGVHPDLEIVIAPITPARPGFDAVYEIVYRNKGNQTMSQLNGISFSFDSNVMSYVSSSDITSSVLPGTLTWNFTNLSPFESRAIVVTMHVNPPTDLSFPVNIGDILTLTSTVNPIAADENPSDNTFEFNQTVVGSFDPNDVTCIEGNMVPPTEIGNYLHYVINFENTGTADAENIVVKDIIDTTQFDVNSMQILNSSAPVTAKLTGNVAEFIFQNINLHSGGHGNILIKIKSKNTLVQGDSVIKKASIYFDYNAPVDTNLENTIFQELSNSDYETDASISVYPNPSKGNVNINCNNNIKSVQLFDVQGRLLQTNLVNESQTSIDISGKSKGVYFIKIISDKGIGVEKIVRE